MTEEEAIPASWTRICGLSLDRTTVGAVWLAHDRREKTIYVYGEYTGALPALPILADAINTRCGQELPETPAWIPVIMDIRAFKRTEVEGATLGGRLAGLGVPLNDGRYDEEAGAAELNKALLSRRLKVGETMRRWLAEVRTWNRSDEKGKLDKLPEAGFHLMRATGLALMLEPDDWISENRAESDRRGGESVMVDRSRNPVTGY